MIKESLVEIVPGPRSITNVSIFAFAQAAAISYGAVEFYKSVTTKNWEK